MTDSPRDDLQSLPDDIEALRGAMVMASAMRSKPSDAAITERDTLLAQNDRLRHLLLKLTRMQFGTKSERLPEEQLQLGLEATRAGDRQRRGRGGEARSRAAQGQCGQAARAAVARCRRTCRGSR